MQGIECRDACLVYGVRGLARLLDHDVNTVNALGLRIRLADIIASISADCKRKADAHTKLLNNAKIVGRETEYRCLCAGAIYAAHGAYRRFVS